MKQKLRITISGTLILFLLKLPFLSNAQERPNILWINCDDLGREISCYGNTDVHTPHMDQLASEGVMFLNAYANAPVCSSSRSSQITGMYPTAINSLNHRTIEKQPLPEGIVPIMEIFQQQGYFCTNDWAHNMNKEGKQDYNFLGDNFFDGTDWKQRAEGQPFFAQVQIHEPHRVFKKDHERPINPDHVQLPDCYPDHPIIRKDWSMYLESVQIADKRVGEIIERLEKENLLENTIIILFGDHGRPHLRDKQWLYEGGLAIPLIVRYPKKFEPKTKRKDLISLVDVTASTLALAGIEVPAYMHGKEVLLGETRMYMYGFKQRCGDAVDDIRSITDGRYKLIWNRMPDRPYMQLSSYKKLQYPAFTVYNVMYEEGVLKAPFDQMMREVRPAFELFDLQNDPNELVNLTEDKKYNHVKNRLKKKLVSTLAEVEKNMQEESSEAIQKAIEGSQEYYKKAMQKRQLSENATDKQILEYWENTLLESN
ncbi:sulfatase [Limibacter armeniacum]|uniref:sulfatase family protein n=1 Tax=Limibacter armeniacum TaxID=466084 RepID=UPI002FE69BE2